MKTEKELKREANEKMVEELMEEVRKEQEAERPLKKRQQVKTAVGWMVAVIFIPVIAIAWFLFVALLNSLGGATFDNLEQGVQITLAVVFVLGMSILCRLIFIATGMQRLILNMEAFFEPRWDSLKTTAKRLGMVLLGLMTMALGTCGFVAAFKEAGSDFWKMIGMYSIFLVGGLFMIIGGIKNDF